MSVPVTAALITRVTTTTTTTTTTAFVVTSVRLDSPRHEKINNITNVAAEAGENDFAILRYARQTRLTLCYVEVGFGTSTAFPRLYDRIFACPAKPPSLIPQPPARARIDNSVDYFHHGGRGLRTSPPTVLSRPAYTAV